MRIIPALKYYAKHWLKGIAGFFPISILVCLWMMFGVRNLFGGGFSGDFSVHGWDMITMVFVFVTCLNAFKEQFLLFNQNGIGRNSQYLAFAVSLIAFSVIIAAIDILLQAGLRSISPYTSVFEQIFKAGLSGTADSGISLMLTQFLWEFSIFFMVGAIGYTLTSFMYRLNKWGKIAFWLGVVFVLNLWPRLFGVTFKFGTPGLAGYICAAILVGAGFLALAYAVTWRIPVKRESAVG